jgi:ribosomal protein S27E
VSGERFRIERFVFPDGTSVEMMVFGTARRQASAPKTAPAATAPPPCCAPPSAEERRAPHRCPVCGGSLVYPVDWDRSGPASWTLRLRCPDCETQREVTLDRASVESLNRELYAGAQALAREADEWTRRNFADEAARIVAALQHDFILPMDF